jgi:hypothetical protein
MELSGELNLLQNVTYCLFGTDLLERAIQWERKMKF